MPLWVVSVLLPLGEQSELLRSPVGPAGRHGRRLIILRRQCRKHAISVVRIRHVGVIVQQYAKALHVRNIDVPKQWFDISCEGNLRHAFSLQFMRGHPATDSAEIRSRYSAFTRRQLLFKTRPSINQLPNVSDLRQAGMRDSTAASVLMVIVLVKTSGEEA